jgi:hypothetical protein
VQWSGKDSFASAPLTPLTISGVEAGQVKNFGGLTVVQVS